MTSTPSIALPPPARSRPGAAARSHPPSRSHRRAAGVLVLAAAVLCGLFGASSANAGATTIRYEVARAGPVKSDLREFRSTVAAILDDPRGWSLSGAVRFKRVTRGGRFAVTLASPRVVGSYGGCSSVYSCRSGRHVLINDERWRRATPTYRGLLELYRQMVVNHEVGHALGFGHAGCRRRGGLAPVMQQQSKSLSGCRRNPWPLPDERRALARRLGVSIGPLPAEAGSGERPEPMARP